MLQCRWATKADSTAAGPRIRLGKGSWGIKQIATCFLEKKKIKTKHKAKGNKILAKVFYSPSHKQLLKMSTLNCRFKCW